MKKWKWATANKKPKDDEYPNFMTWILKKGNKYGAHTNTYNGTVYHSKKEAGYAQELDLRIKAKDIKRWERQIKCSIDVNGFHICNYFVDFLIHHNNGDKELVEVKGFETDVWRMKRRLLEAVWLKENPDYSYTVVK